MSSNTEQIEARLAAYIDGELSPADRVEIEKYLAANPAHRKLIQELMVIRTHTASLPRESAPVEVLDHLQTNLERHALLEDVDGTAGSMRINRWPQWTAAAAMLFLTVGLGTLIYLVLPSGELNRDQIVLAPPTVQRSPANPTFSEVKEEGANPAEDVAAAEMRVATPAVTGNDEVALAARGSNTVTSNPAAGTVADGFGGAGGGVNLGGANLNDANTGTAVAPNNLTLNNGSAIVVQTDDLLLTQNLVAGYLGQNKYDFQPIPGDAITLANTGVLQFNALPSQSRQDVMDVVGKLKQNDGIVSNSVSPEAYLLVRNVTSSRAEELSRALSEQRGGRQQARYFDNAAINSTIRLKDQSYQQQQAPQALASEVDMAMAQSQMQNYNKYEAPRDRVAADAANSENRKLESVPPAPATPPVAKESIVAAPQAIEKSAVESKTGESKTTAQTAAERQELESRDADTTTDVLIVVQATPAPVGGPKFPDQLPPDQMPADRVLPGAINPEPVMPPPVTQPIVPPTTSPTMNPTLPPDPIPLAEPGAAPALSTPAATQPDLPQR